MDTFDWRPPKGRFRTGKKIVGGRVWLITAVKFLWRLCSTDNVNFEHKINKTLYYFCALDTSFFAVINVVHVQLIWSSWLQTLWNKTSAFIGTPKFVIEVSNNLLSGVNVSKIESVATPESLEKRKCIFRSMFLLVLHHTTAINEYSLFHRYSSV